MYSPPDSFSNSKRPRSSEASSPRSSNHKSQRHRTSHVAARTIASPKTMSGTGSGTAAAAVSSPPPSPAGQHNRLRGISVAPSSPAASFNSISRDSTIAARSSAGLSSDENDYEEQLAVMGYFSRAGDEDATGMAPHPGGGGASPESSTEFGGVDTASISSSVRDHVYEGGLRYHAYHAGKYAFPNDEVEQIRDDMKHSMTLMLCDDRMFLAPVEKVLERGGEVLDLGTGTGIWPIQLGDQYPNANILGMDLSAIQPVSVPPRVQFMVDDIEHLNGWDLPENHYDYIHIRHTIHSIRDRQTMLDRCFKHLKPGGYVELQEIHYSPHCDDGSLTPSTPYAVRDFLRFLGDGLRALGSEIDGIVHVPAELRRAGFENVTRRTIKSPVGAWPRDKRLRLCGVFHRTAFMDGLPGLTKRPFGDALGWTKIQIEIFLLDVRKHLMDDGFHMYFPLHIIWGQKPLR